MKKQKEIPQKKITRVAHAKLACQCSISPGSKLRVVLYRKSAKVFGWIQKAPKPRGFCEDVPRGTIEDMSRKSARRLLFEMANAECLWAAMTTLTFRTEPAKPKAVFAEWQAFMRRHGFCVTGHAWVMEFQRRGVTHFHVVWSLDELNRDAYYNGWHVEHIFRNGKDTSVLRGALDSLIVRSWTYAVRDYSHEFINFQNGGTTELLATPETAARYFASYTAKKDQKQIPEGHDAQGRWWYVSPEVKPRPTARARLIHWPFLFVCNTVFDKRELDNCLTSVEPLMDTKGFENAYLGE